MPSGHPASTTPPVRPHQRHALPLRVGTLGSPPALRRMRHVHDPKPRFCTVLRADGPGARFG